MKQSRIEEIIQEEITNVRWGRTDVINEEMTPQHEREIRNIIRSEVSAIFFELFKKRKTWGA